MEKRRDAILDAIVVSAVLGIPLFPVQLFIWFISGLFTEIPYQFSRALFGVDWSTHSGSVIDIRRFFEFWAAGFGVHLVYFVFYFIIGVIYHKRNGMFFVKLRLWIFGTLFTTSLIAMLVGDIRRPVQTGFGRFVMSDFGYSMAYTFLFAFIMFATFAFVSFLIDKYLKFDDFAKVSLAFVISTVVGFLLSGVVWLILFNIFN